MITVRCVCVCLFREEKSNQYLHHRLLTFFICSFIFTHLTITAATTTLSSHHHYTHFYFIHTCVFSFYISFLLYYYYIYPSSNGCSLFIYLVDISHHGYYQYYYFQIYLFQIIMIGADQPEEAHQQKQQQKAI